MAADNFSDSNETANPDNVFGTVFDREIFTFSIMAANTISFGGSEIFLMA